MKDYQEAAFSNWEARLNIMNIVYKRLVEEASQIDPSDAVSLTNGICDEMMAALYFLENLHRQKQTNDLLNSVFK